MNLNKGISTPIAILIIVVVAALAGGVFYWQYSSLKNTEITQVTVPQTLQQSEPSESLKTPTTTKPVDTSDWKTYRNIEYDYQLKVPQDFQNRAKPSAWVGESNDDRISLDKGHQWYITINYDPGAPFWNPPSDAELVSWLRENEVLFGDYQTLDKPNFEIGGIPAVKMYYPGRPQSFNYDIIYFIKNNRLFEFHALADTDRENDMSTKEVKEICKEILSTFEFIEPGEDGTSNWKTYKNEKYGFKFKYPPVPTGCWCEVHENNEEFSVNRTSLSIENSEGLNLSDFVDKETEYFEVTKRERKSIGGKEAILVDYRFGGMNRFGNAAFVKKNENIFVFNFTAGGSCCNSNEIDGIYEMKVYNAMLSTSKFIE